MILSLLLISCAQDRIKMIEEYQELASSVASGQLEDVDTYLNEKSLSYFQNITDPEQLSVEQVIELGLANKVPYFSVLYLASCGAYMKREGKPSDFFRYLANNGVAFFSKYDSYQVSKEKSKIADEGFVAIYRNEFGVNKMTWAKFTRPDKSTFKYDLLYNLQLEEKKYQEIYKNQRAAASNLEMKAFLKQLYKSYNTQNCDL